MTASATAPARVTATAAARTFIAEDKVRYVGDQVAVVVAGRASAGFSTAASK